MENTSAAIDFVVRGTAAQGMIRALAIRADQTVSTAQDKHDASPAVAIALGRLLMAAQMMGCLNKAPGDTISLMIQSAGEAGNFTVTADTDGNARGYAEHPDGMAASVPELLGQGGLVVVRQSPYVEPYVSQIALLNGTISDDLTAYYIISEQIPTIVSLEVLLGEDGRVSHAGGYFIQLMPGYEDSLVDQIQTLVTNADPLATMLRNDLDPEQILQTILGELDYKTYERTDAAFQCDCSRERSERTLTSLGKQELQAMIDEGEPIDIKCDFCNTHYTFTPEQMTQLLETL